MGMMWNKSEMATIRGNVQAPSTGTLKAASKVEMGSSGTAIGISPEQAKQKNIQINTGVKDFIMEVKKSLAADPTKPISKNLEVLNGNYRVDYNPKTGYLTVSFDGKSKEYGGSTNFAREIAQEATEKITNQSYSPDENRANGNTAVFIAENPNDPRSLKTQLKVVNGGPTLKDDFESKGIKGITTETLNDLKSPNTEKRNAALSTIYKSIVDSFPNDKSKADTAMLDFVNKYFKMKDRRDKEIPRDIGNSEVKGEKVIAIKLKPDQINPNENDKPSVTGARPNIGTSGAKGYDAAGNQPGMGDVKPFDKLEFYLKDKQNGGSVAGKDNYGEPLVGKDGKKYVLVSVGKTIGGVNTNKYMAVPLTAFENAFNDPNNKMANVDDFTNKIIKASNGDGKLPEGTISLTHAEAWALSNGNGGNVPIPQHISQEIVAKKGEGIEANKEAKNQVLNTLRTSGGFNAVGLKTNALDLRQISGYNGGQPGDLVIQAHDLATALKENKSTSQKASLEKEIQAEVMHFSNPGYKNQTTLALAFELYPNRVWSDGRQAPYEEKFQIKREGTMERDQFNQPYIKYTYTAVKVENNKTGS